MQEKDSTRRLPTALRPLAAEQDLVVSRAQLAEHSYGHEAVRSRTAGGLWREIGPRVVVLHSGELTGRQRAWAGLLHAGPGCVLALSSAAELGGLVRFAQTAVHVAVAHGREVGDLVDRLVTVRVHQTRHPSSDLVPLRSPARHTIARAVVEMASAAASDDRSRAVLAAAVQQGLVQPADLAGFVETRRTLPKRRLIREKVADVEGGAHSLPELDYALALRRAGLPEPTRQRTVRRSNGVWYLDNDFDDWLVTVEVNGGQHRELLAAEADDVRRAGLQVSGRLVVDISAFAVRHHERVTVLRTAQALLSRGWRPGPRTQEVLADYARRENWPLLAA